MPCLAKASFKGTITVPLIVTAGVRVKFNAFDSYTTLMLSPV